MRSSFFCFIGSLFLLVSASTFAQETYGTIEGNLGWPGDVGIPPMKVCAEKVDSKKIICKKLDAKNYKSAKYQLKLTVGTYFIFTQLLKRQEQVSTDERAYFSEYVTCGHKVECKSHKPIPVTIRGNEKLKNIDPNDWYANEQSK